MPLYYMGQEQGWIEYEGVVPKTGWMWINNRWNKVFRWGGSLIPPLPSVTLAASGVNKMSHSGWARPNLTWYLSSGLGSFETNGTFIMPRGEGYVSLYAGLTTGTNARIVSDLKGVLMQTAFADRAIGITTHKTIFEQGERVHIELNGYSSTSTDTFTFSYGPDEPSA